jgi:hypothetical protein
MPRMPPGTTAFPTVPKTRTTGAQQRLFRPERPGNLPGWKDCGRNQSPIRVGQRIASLPSLDICANSTKTVISLLRNAEVHRRFLGTPSPYVPRVVHGTLLSGRRERDSGDRIALVLHPVALDFNANCIELSVT